MTLNPAQQALVETYGHGDFAHVSTTEEAREVSDTLFLFLFVELSAAEGCDSTEEAIRRIDAAISDLEEIRSALEVIRE